MPFRFIPAGLPTPSCEQAWVEGREVAMMDFQLPIMRQLT